MARREVIDCDGCGEHHPHAKAISVFVDRCMDPAGSMDDVWERVDLCPECMALHLNIFLGKNGSADLGRDWIKLVKRPLSDQPTRCRMANDPRSAKVLWPAGGFGIKEV